jgi:hypothetical protein
MAMVLCSLLVWWMAFCHNGYRLICAIIMKAIDVVSKIKDVLAGLIAREFPLTLVYLSAYKARNQVKVSVFAMGIDIIDHSGKRIIRLHRRSAHLPRRYD